MKARVFLRDGELGKMQEGGENVELTRALFFVFVFLDEAVKEALLENLSPVVWWFLQVGWGRVLYWIGC